MQAGKNKEKMNEWSCGSIRCVYVIVRKEMRIDGNKASRLHPGGNVFTLLTFEGLLSQNQMTFFLENDVSVSRNTRNSGKIL